MVIHTAEGHPNKKNVWIQVLNEIRPEQWTKNLLIFAALLFSNNIPPVMIYKTVAGFILFCFVSSCVYIFNDFIDREIDRNHPEKKHRPIASGALNAYFALTFSTILISACIVASFVLNPTFGLLILAYFIMNIAYSLWLKQVVIIDVMVIAIGFVFRALGGGILIEVSFTPWFLLCIFLLSLFLGLSKRKSELLLLRNAICTHRKVLEQYSEELLNQLISITTTATILCYSLFTFTSGHSIYLMGTIPLAIYGIFRYLYLIHVEESGDKPEKILIEDKHILGTVLIFSIYVVVVIKHFG